MRSRPGLGEAAGSRSIAMARSNSVADMVATTAPRLRSMVTSSSAANARNASRTGVRDRSNISPIRCSTSRAPGTNSPSTIAVRISR
nr:hypothetical protein [Mycolicibacterium sp. P1-5]